MSGFAMAKHHNGVCQGSLQKTITISGSKNHTGRSSNSNSKKSNKGGGGGGVFSFGRNKSSSLSSSSPVLDEATISTYAFLVGVKLVCHESTTAMWNGDHPLAQYSLVGVSPVSDDSVAFRAVTDKGTHLLCTVPTKACREVWLSALNAGLEYRLLQDSSETTTTTTKTKPTTTTGRGGDTSNSISDKALSPVKPKFPRGVKYKSEPSRYCHSCGKVELNRSSDSPSYYLAPMPQYGSEERVDLCSRCHLAQGVLEHCYWMEELYTTHHQEQNAMLEARCLVLEKLSHKRPTTRKQQSTDNNSPTKKEQSGESEQEKDPSDDNDNDTIDKSDSSTGEESKQSDRDSTGRLLPKSHTLRLEPMSNHVLGLTLESKQGVALQRLSPFLRSLCVEFQQGMIGVLEFIELLEAAIGIRDPAMADLKKQAFRVAGDMGTALKLLYEQCVPPSNQTPSSSGGGGNGANNNNTIAMDSARQSNFGSNNLGSTELLQCILEFFLDLVVEEDELNTLAFFWPQISNIHLQMLPPRDTLSLQKIELLEDFLLTVASKHSIHLAIELVWSHTADLEDALSGSYNGSTTTFCGRRKSAVLRFLCELESLLFDFDTGWGGGSVTVGQFMSPSDHQVELLKSSMSRIQNCRLAADHDRLTRSYRLDKLQAAAARTTTHGDGGSSEMMVMAKEAVRVANNADYMSSHLAFTKRLCDVAEKLRFLPVNERKGVLSTELAKLNASGTMGGDPINIIKENNEGHTRVVRMPILEGHVFRSKARTPVLLLVEIIEEGAALVEDEEEEKYKVLSKKEGIEESASPKENSDYSKDAVLEAIADDENEREVSPKQEAAETVSTEEESKDSTGAPPAKAKCEELKESLSNDDEAGNNFVANESEEELVATTPIHNPSNFEDAEEDDDSSNNREATLSSTPAAPPDALSPGHMTPVSGTPQIKDRKGDSGTTPKMEGRKVLFDDIVMPELDTITRSARLESTDTAGSNLSASHHEKAGIPRHALRRFDSPKRKPKIVTPIANKELIENLMTGVLANQLQLPNLVTDIDEDENESEKDVESISNQESVGLPTGEDGQFTENDSTIEKEEKQQEQEQQQHQQQQQQQQRSSTPNYSKMKNLGTVTNSQEQYNALHKTGGTRREVLTAIMTKGMSGSHVIAKQAATGAKRHLQDLERRVAVEALLTGDSNIPHGSTASPETDSRRNELLNLGIRSSISRENASHGEKSENDETMEAIRLLLIQFRVAKDSADEHCGEIVLSPEKDYRTLMHNEQALPEIDAGDVDSRLVGCGILPPAVLQALNMWKGETISNGELLELVKKDLEFEKNLKAVEQNTDKLNEDSAFWGRFAFGERWAEKRSRIAASSPDSSTPGWDLTGIIVKSNDDLRQESFVMQLIELCDEAFQEAELELWLLPYRIVSTGRSTGILGLIRNSMSFDGLKKRPGYGTGGIRGHLQRMSEHAANPGEAFQSAQKNFVRSLAAYSLLSYMFLFKDRHNGNIMLDTDGHVIHIDFGFVFGIAPGGNFSLEMTTPFKLTEEMIEVMDGLRSSLFSEFVTLFCCGFLALQAHYNTFVTLVEVTSKGSTFPCFDGRDTTEIINKMEERFCPDLNKEESVAHVLDIIKEAVGSYGTKQYDYFQYMSQGIAT